MRQRHPHTGKKREPFFAKGTEEQHSFFAGSKSLQAKLAIGRSADPMEKEADNTARQVQVQKAEKKEEEPVQKAEKKEEEPVQKAEKKEEEPVQAKADIQKQEEKKEEPVQAKLKPMVQAALRSDSSEETTAAHSFESALTRRKGKGFELPDELRRDLEKKIGARFGQVRLHTDKEAADMCESIHALAFTHGYDIYFNEGQYNPNADAGIELLAHELTHVVQQKGRGEPESEK